MNETPNILEQAVKAAGGSQVVAAACGGLSYQAVNKWIKNGMPYTEWTGQTQYALTIVRLCGGQFTVGQLLTDRESKA